MSQPLRDIAVFFDDSESGRRILEIAANLAGEHNAHLIGICAAANDYAIPEDAYARGDAVQDVVRRQQSSVAAHLLYAGQALARAAVRHGIETEFRVIPFTESGGDAALHSLYCDLLVAGHPAPGAPLAWSSTQMLEKTGVPIMLVPDTWIGDVIGRRIVLAWNGSRQARRAVADALPLLVSAEVVALLIVDSEHVDEPTHHDKEPLGVDMANYLTRHGVHVDLSRISSQGRGTAETILNHAVSRNADLIVFGAYSRSRISETLFGGVTRTLLKTGQVPLFVSH